MKQYYCNRFCEVSVCR